MPPTSPDSPVGRASGPVGVARRIRPVREPRSARDPGSASPATAARVAPASNDVLESLLVDLGSQVRRGVSQEAAEALQPLATGLPDLDARLGGGFPGGRLSEICGLRSSGRTALAFRLLAETLGRGVLGAWIDLANAFDPTSAAASGVDLDRLLWVRPPGAREAVHSTERLLQTEGFELVFFDLSPLPSAAPSAAPAASPPRKPMTRVPMKQRPAALRDVTWLRLARLAASTRTALVVLSQGSSPPGNPSPELQPDPFTTGSRAELVLEMQSLGARFTGPPDLLETLETTAVLRRHRARPVGTRVALSFSS